MKPGGDLGRQLSVAASVLCAITAVLLAPAAAHAGAAANASIVGGKVASIQAFPSLAFVDARKAFTCTGTVISPRVVLTAAHCVEDLDAGGFTPTHAYVVTTGLTNPHRAGPGNLSQVTSTHVFPKFNPGTGRLDAAVLILATPTSSPAIELATAADAALYEGGATVLLAGWGVTHPSDYLVPKRLHSTSSVVQDPDFCRGRIQPLDPTFSVAAQMCATNPPAHATGTCSGDSGGPAIVQRPDGSYVEIGIASSVLFNCSTKLPNIFARTDRIATWAAEWIAATEHGAPPPSANGSETRLPRMGGESADEFLRETLLNAFGVRILNGEKLRAHCRRVGRARIRCSLRWRYGPSFYYGAVAVYYESRRGAVVWDNQFRIHRVNFHCRFASGHPRACPVHTRQR